MPETTKLFNCGDNKIKEIQYFPNHLEKARMECDIEVVSAIYSNKELLFKECNSFEETFLYHGLCYERSQRKYIVTNPADYDKYSDMVKKYVIDGEELIIKYYM